MDSIIYRETQQTSQGFWNNILAPNLETHLCKESVSKRAFFLYHGKAFFNRKENLSTSKPKGCIDRKSSFSHLDPSINSIDLPAVSGKLIDV